MFVMIGLEDQFSKFFLGKLPPLSLAVKEQLARYIPWIMIVFGVLGLIAWLSTIGLFSFGMMVAGAGIGQNTGYLFSIYSLVFIYILTPLMQALGIYGGCLMLKRRLIGWRIGFYSVLIGVAVHLGHLSIFGLLVDAIFLYMLFQIKEFYSESP